MVYTSWKIIHTPYVASSYASASTTEITDFHSPLVEVNLGEGRDMFKIKIQNNYGTYDNFFSPKDKITIYRGVNKSSASLASTDILMVGALNDVPVNYDGKKEILSLDGYNFSEAVMSGIAFVDAENMDVYTAISTAVDNVKNFNQSFGVSMAASNPTSKSDGNPFPTVGKRYYYKPVKTILEELSVNTATQDGRYFWYVDNNNELIWKRFSDYGDGTFTESTDTPKRIKIGKDSKDVKNYFILKGGTRPDGKQVQTYYADYASIARHGMKFMIYSDEAKYINELNKIDTDAESTEPVDRYPDLSSSYTTQWVVSPLFNGEQNKVISAGGTDTTIIPGSTVTINSGSEANNKRHYNEVMREVGIDNLKRKGAELATIMGKGKLELEVSFQPGSKSWGVGDRISCTLNEFGSSPKILRVNEIQYSEDMDIYTLKEDEGTI